jgi:hypothetical protein
MHPFYKSLNAINSYELRSQEFQGVAESGGRSKSAIFGRDEVSYENPRTPSAARPEYFTVSYENATIRFSGETKTQGVAESGGRSKSAIFGRDAVSYENPTASPLEFPCIPENVVRRNTSQSRTKMIFGKDGVSYKNSQDVDRWNTLFENARDKHFDKQVTLIIVFYFSMTIEHTPELSKFRLWKQMDENRLLTESIREEIIEMFQRAQRCYRGLSRFARIVRLRKTPVQITADLYMTELLPTNPDTFVLLDNDRIYYFALRDLVRILTEALTFTPYSFFSEPNICKNPYNNLPFTKATLYNIYFRMKARFCTVPKFIQLFFEVDFNIYEFKQQNESAIREHKIREYISRTDPAKMVPDVLRMFMKYDTKSQIIIHSQMPCDELIRKVKPLYYLYLLRKYSICPSTREKYHNVLVYKMKDFIRLNPQFGRKIYVMRSLGKRETPRFHTEVIRPLESSFAETHQYDDATYNRFVHYGVLSVADSSDDESQLFVDGLTESVGSSQSDSRDEVLYENVSNSGELRSLEFPRIPSASPSATQTEYFTQYVRRQNSLFLADESESESESDEAPQFDEAPQSDDNADTQESDDEAHESDAND